LEARHARKPAWAPWRGGIMHGKTIVYALLLQSCTLLFSNGIQAADGFPTKPVRLIIPYSAGGATDVVTRVWAPHWGEALGQQMVIDNRPGAGGLIGTEIAANATPDGYTLLAVGTPLVIVPHLYRKTPYDPIKDFTPIMQYGQQPYALTVHPSLGVKSVQELIDLAKKQPGKINYASSGNGGGQHLFAALFVSMADIDMVHVPYKGSGPARADLLAGQVKVGCLGISSIIQHHNAGKLRILGLTGTKRSSDIPDIPTIAETLPGYEAYIWSGLLAPDGTPPDVIEKIHAETSRLLARPDVQAAFKRIGTDLVATDPKTFSELVRKDYRKWGDVVRKINLKQG
jgi:tripartite-type tricarboxylate transporter receptor subunit TctC